MAARAAPAVVELRSAAPAECAALSDLCLRSKAYWGYDHAFLEACREELTIRPHEIGDLVRVAEVDGRPAGVAQLGHEGGDWHVEKLFVDAPYVGRGVGGALMRWLIEQAQARGAKCLVIEADPGAAAFYRRFGARDDGQVASGSIPGRFIPRLVLELV